MQWKWSFQRRQVLFGVHTAQCTNKMDLKSLKKWQKNQASYINNRKKKTTTLLMILYDWVAFLSNNLRKIRICGAWAVRRAILLSFSTLIGFYWCSSPLVKISVAWFGIYFGTKTFCERVQTECSEFFVFFFLETFSKMYVCV